MRIRALFIIISGLSVFFSSGVLAHETGSGAGLMDGLLHNFTGEHLLMLIVAGLCVVCVKHFYHRKL